MRTGIKRGVAAWIVVGVVLLAWSGAAYTANAGERDRVKDETAQGQKLERFYRIVGGEVQGGASPGDKLAKDLRDLPANQVAGYKGDSNRYGGISGDLGFDPFVEDDGIPEGGLLDVDIQLYVLDIKAGRLQEVLTEIEQDVAAAETEGGVPTWLWIIWTASLPTYVLIYQVRRRKIEEEKYQEVADERDLLQELRHAQRELPPASEQWGTLDNLANELEAQMEKRLHYKDQKSRAMRVEMLTSEARDALEAFSAGNKSLD